MVKDTAGAPKGMTKKKVGETFTSAQEAELAQWFEEHPIFYDQSLKEFKMTGRKIKVGGGRKGKELGVTGKEVFLWYKSQRTIYGRLKKKKSGEGAKAKTARQEWLLRAFSFLGSHVVIRSERRQLGSIPVPDVPDVDEEEEQEEEAAEEEASEPTQPTEPAASQPAASKAKSRGKGKSKSKSGGHMEDFMRNIAEQVTGTVHLQEQVARAAQGKYRPQSHVGQLDGQ